jgi:decaprenylphospho-beta-D-erythro-pentofuranosid-2-ulose 2-reductase
MKSKHAIVIGASSGIGRELVRQLAASGTKVAAVARRKDLLEDLKASSPDNILIYTHDVSHHSEAEALFMQMTQDLGGLDLFVYSSGVMPTIEPTEFDFEKDKLTVDVNITGATLWCNLAAQRFQNVKYGTIIGIGSVAGERGRFGFPVYNASKAYLATYLEALRNRLSGSGVKVITIKPGPVDTEMTQHLTMKKMPVDTAAKIIISKIGTNGEYFLSLPHKVIFGIIRNIPSFMFRKIKI